MEDIDKIKDLMKLYNKDLDLERKRYLLDAIAVILKFNE